MNRPEVLSAASALIAFELILFGAGIGIRDLGDDQWCVQFGPVDLGILDKKTTRLTKPGAKPYGSMLPMGPYRLKQQPREAPHGAA